VTCRAIVEQYLRRIEAYDKNGPAINAIVVVNPDAARLADDLDRRAVQGGFAGPLHCVPMIVKDNFETVGLQSANGSLALAGFVSSKDAFQVKRVKDAGAIVLAKSNMAEWAFTPFETVSSILPGYTKNPYALDRVTAGSSGGTAAAVAASFGAVGLGSDTGNSIRGPSSHQALAGIRSTMGLTSRAGVMPLNLLADIAGPMARTVEDAAKVFQVVAGEDPDDPVTAAARGRKPGNYTAALVRDGLKGARIGILRQAYERDTADPEIVQVFMSAVEELRMAGAIIVDPAAIPELDSIRRAQGVGPCQGFKYDINRYLASHGEKVPVKSLAEIVKSGRFHPSVQRRLEQANDGPENGPDTPACKAEMAYREQVRAAVLKTMDALTLDAYVYPTWSNPPRLIGDLNTPAGDNSQFFSPTTGFPAVQVPMGYTRGVLPAGMTFFGRAWSEALLIKLAYAYEQATHHRRPPTSTPPLR
jgi:Asp-tRNA(Asn)/Glu-tRNA(Gln) amidotransferase A subunit family amidase